MSDIYANSETTTPLDLLSQLWKATGDGRVLALSAHVIWKSMADLESEIRMVRNTIHGGSAGFELVSKRLADASHASTTLATQLNDSSTRWISEITAANRAASLVAKQLMWATWALVGATIILVVVTALQA